MVLKITMISAFLRFLRPRARHNEPFAFERMAHRVLQEVLEQRVNALPQGGARTVSKMPRKDA